MKYAQFIRCKYHSQSCGRSDRLTGAGSLTGVQKLSSKCLLQQKINLLYQMIFELCYLNPDINSLHPLTTFSMFQCEIYSCSSSFRYQACCTHSCSTTARETPADCCYPRVVAGRGGCPVYVCDFVRPGKDTFAQRDRSEQQPREDLDCV